MSRLFLVLAMLAGAVWPAAASGGIWCDADDERTLIHVESGVSSLGGALFGFQARMELRRGDVADDLREVSFEREHAAQYWYDGTDLRLLLYREREEGDHAFVEITIVTSSDDFADLEFRGRYDIRVFDVGVGDGTYVEASGMIACAGGY